MRHLVEGRHAGERGLVGEVEGPPDYSDLIFAQISAQAILGTMDVHHRLQLWPSEQRLPHAKPQRSQKAASPSEMHTSALPLHFLSLAISLPSAQICDETTAQFLGNSWWAPFSQTFHFDCTPWEGDDMN